MSLQKLEINDELQQGIKGLNSEFNKNHDTLKRKIKELKDVSKELEDMHKSTTVVSLVGSSIGVTGGAIALVGLGLSFFTFGASLAVSAIGGAVGIGGGFIGAIFNRKNMVQQKKLRETIENIIKDFQKTINPMIQHLNTITNKIDELQQEGQKYSVLNKTLMTSVRSVKTCSSIGKLLTVLQTARLGRTAAKAVRSLKVIGKITGTISTLFLALDVYSIYCDSVEISELNQPEKERKADEIKSETLKFINEIKKTADQFQVILDEIKSARDDINRECGEKFSFRTFICNKVTLVVIVLFFVFWFCMTG
ncbi:apolipoprotein L2-like isoform X2 [Triplophysa dalaica]|nr:apolipoprotein L2-like isoform X2 [Triplophysa dalaica]XP_056593412.1 apolipoprotein L2-like isoform X2 [Triplophysa dalaica]XP_056593413.1 apolipoprotein L2-like isoform X2 [Triplophysa dalaica]